MAAQLDGRIVYRAFLAHCQADSRKRALLSRLAKRGCNAGRIFACALRYWTKPSDLDELTREHEKAMRRILREAMRRGGPPEFRAAILTMQNHADEVFDCKRKGVAHCTESLIWLEEYIRAFTRRRPTPSELALLLEATAEALGRTPFDVEKANVRRELRRFKARHVAYMKILPGHVSASIAKADTLITD